MSKSITKLISPLVLCTSIKNRVLSWFDRFTAFWNFMSKSDTKLISPFCAQVSQIVFQADLTVLRLIRTVWAKMSQNSYLREFCAQVSQIVFLADLTVLRLIRTVWAKMSQNSYLCEFCVQVSRVLNWLDDSTLYYNCMRKNVTKLISPQILCTRHKSCS